MRTVFVNPERCIGCRQCEFACAVEHSESRDPFLALFEDPLPRPRIHVEPGPWPGTSFANRCRHCNPAPCERSCPTAAISRDADEDLVLIEPRKCITCAMCAMVCPFDAVTFHEQPAGARSQESGQPLRVVATKCDGCIERVQRGQEPACSEVCKVDALVFGELNALVKEGRLRQSVAVLTAVSTVESEVPAGPETLAGWRAWGEAAATVAREVRDEFTSDR